MSENNKAWPEAIGPAPDFSSYAGGDYGASPDGPPVTINVASGYKTVTFSSTSESDLWMQRQFKDLQEASEHAHGYLILAIVWLAVLHIAYHIQDESDANLPPLVCGFLYAWPMILGIGVLLFKAVGVL